MAKGRGDAFTGLVAVTALCFLNCSSPSTSGEKRLHGPVEEAPIAGSSKGGSKNVVPQELRAALIERAVAAAKDAGKSTAGLKIAVSDYGNAWMVWFVEGPEAKPQSGGAGFVVRISKRLEVPVEILKFQ